jgi:Fur family ferric uptake transcriptional regulator
MTYNTDRRKQIITFVSSDGSRAFTTEEICEELLLDGKGKSTVYRIISELVSEGILKKISDGATRHVRYQYLGEKKCSKHLHLKCKLCGRLIHLDEPTSKLISSSLLDAAVFTIDPTEILLGVCKGCI